MHVGNLYGSVVVVATLVAIGENLAEHREGVSFRESF